MAKYTTIRTTDGQKKVRVCEACNRYDMLFKFKGVARPIYICMSCFMKNSFESKISALREQQREEAVSG